MKYGITIEETVSKTFELELDTEDASEARDIAIERYKSGGLVLEPGEVEERKIFVEGNDEVIGWSDF